LKIKALIITSTLLLGACSSTAPPEIRWFTQKNVDQFDDTSSCRVTVGGLYYANGTVLTYTNQFYPFVETVEGDLRVGVLSGGKVQVPVGNVQLRIDNNDSWTIETQETPVDYVPSSSTVDMTPYMSSLTSEQKAQYQATFENSMENATKIMSPYTAVSGEKAKKILSEMVSGTKLIYRRVGFNQAASSTGEYKLDMSFQNALTECGINL